MENPIKMDDLGVPLFSETPIYLYYILETSGVLVTNMQHFGGTVNYTCMKTIQITQNVGNYTSPMDHIRYRSPSQMELSEMGVWSLDRFGCQSSGTHTWIPSINYNQSKHR